MFDIKIDENKIEKLIKDAEKQVVDELVAIARKKLSINSLIESAKARLTNNLQKEIANRILESIDISSLIETAVNTSENLVQETIEKTLKEGLYFKIKMDK